jgi:hypothetical protein
LYMEGIGLLICGEVLVFPQEPVGL